MSLTFKVGVGSSTYDREQASAALAEPSGSGTLRLRNRRVVESDTANVELAKGKRLP